MCFLCISKFPESFEYPLFIASLSETETIWAYAQRQQEKVRYNFILLSFSQVLLEACTEKIQIYTPDIH